MISILRKPFGKSLQVVACRGACRRDLAGAQKIEHLDVGAVFGVAGIDFN